MEKKVVALILVLLLIVSVGCAKPKPAPKPKEPRPKKKVTERRKEAWEDFYIYVAHRDPEQVIPALAYPTYRMKPDGSELALARFGGQVIYSEKGCSFSNDGKRVVWTELIGSNQVSVMNSDGTGKVSIKEGVQSYEPVLSHDGATASFVAVREFATERMKENIAIAHLGTSVSVFHTENPYMGSSASSPSYDLFSERIYFDAQIYESRDIFSFDAMTGKDLIRLTADRYENSRPRVTPDNRKVIFVSDRAGKLDIYTISNKGVSVPDQAEDWQAQEAKDHENDFFKNQQVFRLTQEGENKDPAISPDGNVIAFSSNRDGNWEIYLMRIDGSAQKRLTFNTVDDFSPTWSPL
jgi:Tol biopolymer transport system component